MTKGQEIINKVRERMSHYSTEKLVRLSAVSNKIIKGCLEGTMSSEEIHKVIDEYRKECENE